MTSRLLLSDWFGGILGLFLVASLVCGVHDDRPSTKSESVAVWSSIAALGVWAVAKGFAAWHSRRAARLAGGPGHPTP